MRHARQMIAVAWASVAVMTFSGSAAAQAPQLDTSPSFLPDTRALAINGHRTEALARLQVRLSHNPNDADARVLYGTVLSWEGRYDEARAQLQAVLKAYPNDSDARSALVNIEIWSGHPEAAERIIGEALARNPSDAQLLLELARAQMVEKRQKDAMETLNTLLAADPGNHAAVVLRRDIGDESFACKTTVGHEVDWFTKSLASQQETWASLSRASQMGSVIARLSRADRFQTASYQGEIDLYPSIGTGTYGYLNLGYSDARLYPRYRVGSDLFHNFAWGIEASAGYRRLKFGSAINIFTGSVGKYYGNWFFNLRPYFTPDLGGTSKSITASARRYFGSNGQFDYIGFGAGYGASLQARSILDFDVLKSTSLYAEANKSHGHWAGQLHLGWKRETYTFASGLNHYLANANLYYRF